MTLHTLTDKNAIRIQYLDVRQRTAPAVVAAAAKAVSGHLMQMFSAGPIIAGYRPVRGELDISIAMKQLADRGNLLCLPVIEAADRPLYFKKWSPGMVMEKGRYGIEIPPVGAPVFRPDIVLVPLVAFDRAGNRLGYGAGYYDRTLERLRHMSARIQAIGIGYGFQEIESIEPEPHDQKLDAIVTEKGVILCSE